jgi:hypothetical protein
MKGQENYSAIRRIIFVLIILVVLSIIVLAISGQSMTIANQIKANLGLIAPGIS